MISAYELYKLLWIRFSIEKKISSCTNSNNHQQNNYNNHKRFRIWTFFFWVSFS